MEKYIMKVNGCCCCFTLRTGTLILLWLGLISSVWNLVTRASNMALITNAPGADAATKFIVSVVFFYFFVHLVFLSIIPCALGLYGIYENRPSYLKPYIFVSIFEIVCILISCVFIFLVLIFDVDLLTNLIEEGIKRNGQDPKNVGTAIGITAFLIIFTLLGVALLCWYFLSVVYRYYLQLKGVQPTSYSTSDYNAPPRYDGPMKA